MTKWDKMKDGSGGAGVSVAIRKFAFKINFAILATIQNQNRNLFSFKNHATFQLTEMFKSICKANTLNNKILLFGQVFRNVLLKIN